MFKSATSFFRGHYKLTALLFGMASALGFAPTYAVPVVWFSLAGVFLLTDLQCKMRQVAAVGYWYGFGMFAVGFYWIGNALLIDAATFGWLYPLALFGAGAFFGLFTIVPFIIWYKFSISGSKIFGFGATWVLLEWTRSFVLSGFPWNLLGTVFTVHPAFMQTASLWGVYGLSFLVVLQAGGLYLIFRKRWFAGMSAFAGTLLLMFVFGLWRIGQYEYILGDIKIRLVQPSIAQEMKWNRQALENNFATYIDMSLQTAADDIDFVVWGETAVPFDLDRDWAHLQQIKAAVPPNGYLITGMVRFNGMKAYNSLYVLNPEGGVEDIYDKSHLVPFGEYIPLKAYLPSWIQPIAAGMADFGSGRPYKNIKISDYPAFGALICYEIIFPGEVADKRTPPSWLVVLTNDGWYGNSAGPYQHLAAAQMRAVEEGLTVVRSANSGISAVIDPLGRIIDSLPLNAKEVLDIVLPQSLNLCTFYGKYKNVPVIFFMVLILCGWFVYEGLRKRDSAKTN